MPDLTEQALLDFIKQAGPVSKNQIADAFGQRGDLRIALKDLLRTLEQRGVISKIPGQLYALPQGLPDVVPLKIVLIDVDGDIFAEPLAWDSERQGPCPRVEVDIGSHEPTLSEGDHILARIRLRDGLYEGRMIRRLETETSTIIGEVVKTRTGLAVRTLEKRRQDHYDVRESDLNGAKPHDIVRAELTHARGPRSHRVAIQEVLGRADDPKVISLIALHELGLRHTFPSAVIAESEAMKRPVMGEGRTDLRDIPLVTIDGEDARDFDDAVFAEQDESPDNKGGFHLLVAIADVSYYVHAESELDKEAYKRGNSTYFPDRVLPMLPEALSNDLCSLRPKEDRYTLAVHLWIDKEGHLIRYQFVRGLMRSVARLTYTQVQAAYDGAPNDLTEPLLAPVIRPLYAAYRVLLKARAARGTLELDLPERKILIDDKGAMTGVTLRERFDSHKLIEEFMILANVAAALALTEKKAPCVFRVHERPSFEKMDNLRSYLATFSLQLPKGPVDKPAKLAGLVQQAQGKPFARLVHESLLRSQSQALYATDNAGHFGLALQYYAHFTSPIRRYADLLVHRSLIAAYRLGDGGLHPSDHAPLPAMCEHISKTERLSMEAERNAVDRFSAAFMSDKIGAIFTATISGVTRFGLFVRLNETGADGLIPIRLLDGDYFHHDERLHALIGRRSGRVYRLGAQIRVVLLEVVPLAGSMLFQPADGFSADIPGFELQVQARPPREGRPNRPQNRGKNGRNKGKKGPKHRRA